MTTDYSQLARDLLLDLLGRGLTQRRLSEGSGVSMTTITSILAGHTATARTYARLRAFSQESAVTPGRGGAGRWSSERRPRKSKGGPTKVGVMVRTLVMVKPDGVKRNLVGACLAAFEGEGLGIADLKLLTLSPERARELYRVHRNEPFFDSLVAYMSSGPVVAAVLEGPDAVRRAREVMGATDPAEAAPGTLRALYGESIQRNTVHGSDGEEAVEHEVGVIFGPR